jgi:DNA processing protein
LRTLLERFGSADSVFAASRTDLAEVLDGKASLVDAILAGPDPAQVGQELAWLALPHSHVVTQADTDYPPLLREIADAPVLLFLRGERSVLLEPQIAVVGSRNPTPGGCDNAREFARALADAGLIITSGLALGIDACAHRGALEAGGRTIAVAATGLDRVYPARHRDLAHEIVSQGAIVSEFPLGSPPKREHFPRRNRIISGLSVGVVVVEAALQSGSLITARLGTEQGREVFAIPGSIHSPLARGCHALIRQGAKLVETARDILEELGPLVSAQISGHRRNANESRPAVSDSLSRDCQEFARILPHFGHDPVTIDTLVERSGLTPDAISSMLLQMELHGLIEVCPGGKYQRTS